MKDMERLKKSLGIDSSIIEQQYFTMKLIKYNALWKSHPMDDNMI
jgi:hypothetical protein